MDRTPATSLPEPLFAEISSRVQRAVAIAKSVAERHISAVSEADLSRTYARAAGPASAANATLRLAVDGIGGELVGELVDRDTGTVIGRLPSEEILRLIALTREMMSGPLTKRYEDNA